MENKEKVLNMSQEEFNCLMEELRTIMDECDAKHLEINNQIFRHKKYIEALKKDNEKMDAKMKRVFGQRNNRQIKEALKLIKSLYMKTCLHNPREEFESACYRNGLDHEKLAEIFEEERGWTVTKTWIVFSY